MESWQKQHIEQFLAILAYTTKCSEPLMNTLTSSGLIDENGVSQLVRHLNVEYLCGRK